MINQVLEELHSFLVSRYRDVKKPIPDEEIMNFLSQRCNRDAIAPAIALAESRQLMVRVDNSKWMPKPKFVHGIQPLTPISVSLPLAQIAELKRQVSIIWKLLDGLESSIKK